MIVVAIIAIIAAVAIPKLMSARISANENAAIATLRSVAAAQQQFQASCAIDTDADGGGEYGFFGELSGVAELRIYDAAGDAPAMGAGVDDLLDPPFLATAFGDITDDAGGQGVVERQGYFFKMFLPAATAAGVTPAFAEAPAADDGGTLAGDIANWASGNSEILWACYAWPSDHEKTGKRAFFINQEGDVIQFDNRDGSYDGIAAAANVPTFDAAYAGDEVAASMDEPLGIASMGFTSNDGNIWTVTGN